MEKTVCAAIDIGTTNTGIAFKVRDDTTFYIESWDQPLANKAPSSVLFDASPAKKFVAFGYEAEDLFKDWTEQDKPCYFFKAFKMKLHKLESFDKDEPISTFNKPTRELRAVYVFSETIKHLKEKIVKKFIIFGISSKNVQWVITVPAIWSGSARQLMREAAYEANLCSRENLHDLILALEPESASFAIRKTIDPERLSLSSDIKKYMIVDCGGGTIDICVHEVVSNRGNIKVKEIHKATGSTSGGDTVNEAFNEYFKDMISEDSYDELQQCFPQVWLQIVQEFEKAKLQTNTKRLTKTRYVLNMPAELQEVCKSIKNITSLSNGQMTYKTCKLTITFELMQSFFIKTIEDICKDLRNLVGSPPVHEIDTIFMAGGFSESTLLFDKINDSFPGKNVRLISTPSLAVVSGAMEYGFYPAIICQRLSASTYGLSACREFKAGDPENNKIYNKSGVAYCNNIFREFIKYDTPITSENNKVKRIYTPIDADQKGMQIGIFTTRKENVKYTNDPKVKKVGTLNVKMGGYGIDREVEVEIDISGTEIFASIKDLLTNEVTFTSVDFLQLP